VTAFEVSQRVEQYIRQALPIFEPMESEYNAGICDDSFTLMWRNGAFGSPLDWPKSLRGAEIGFTFESPLHDAIDQQKGQLLLQGAQLLATAQAFDPTVPFIVDGPAAYRDALDGIGWPGKWMTNEDVFQQKVDSAKQQQAAAAMLQNMATGASAAKDLGAAHASIAGAAPQPAEAAA